MYYLYFDLGNNYMDILLKDFDYYKNRMDDDEYNVDDDDFDDDEFDDDYDDDHDFDDDEL